MQTKDTRKQDTAAMPNGGAAVEALEPIGSIRPTAAGRIARPPTARLAWLRALIATSEQQRAALRAALAASAAQPVGKRA